MVTNSRGDVVGIVNGNGVMIVNYEYDAWGNVLSVTDQNGAAITSSGHLGNLNSIRYRGYYYDTDLGMYYLQSRYYDPEVRRFINADDVSMLEEDQGSIVEHNLFAYCLNNPVGMIDTNGDFPIALVPVGIGVYEVIECVVIAGKITILACMTAEVGSKLYKKYKNKKKIKYSEYLRSTRVLSDVKYQSVNKKIRLYKRAYIKNGKLIKHGNAMSYEEAYKYIVTKSLTKSTQVWGVYAFSKIAAKALAVGLGGAKGKKPEVHGHMYYAHYHGEKHGYHIWYGTPINYM